MKKQNSEWEKITAKETTDKASISKTYKQLIQLNTKKNKQSNQKTGRRSKQTFLQRRIQTAYKHEKMVNISHYSVQFSSVQFIRSVVSDSLQPLIKAKLSITNTEI